MLCLVMYKIKTKYTIINHVISRAHRSVAHCCLLAKVVQCLIIILVNNYNVYAVPVNATSLPTV